MSKAERLLNGWRNKCPADVSAREFEAVIDHHLGRWLRKKSSRGSHLFIVEHPALAFHSNFSPHNTFSAPVKSGRRVKGIYVKHLIKAIDCIQEWEGDRAKEEDR